MNYRHHYHAGNFADVVKHVVLGALISGMKKKEKGFLFLDTHAGRGTYDLLSAKDGESLPREPEWPAGYGKVKNAANVPAAVASYISAVQAFDRQSGNLGADFRFYPGSPWLAKIWVRPQDRLAFCELQSDEHSFLATSFARESKVSVQKIDGYSSLRAMLPSPEKRALVLIDPPFESQAEWANIVKAIADGIRRMPSATLAIWYPLTERARIDRFIEELRVLELPPSWIADVAVAGERSSLKMRGCGLAVINPPWQIDVELRPVMKWLADALAQGAGASGTIQWIVPER